jgi:hypothetical protein
MGHWRQIYAKTECILQWVAALKRSFCQNVVYFFCASTGIYNLAVGDLGLSNYLTVDGRLCPAVASVLGIDVLNKLDISFSDDLERLFLTQNDSY